MLPPGVQICNSDDVCYIFLFYKWNGVCYKSFLDFMADASIKKEALGVANDASKFLARFPTAGRRGAAPLVAGTSELATTVSDAGLESGKLEVMTSSILGEYVDKSIDHRAWEAPTLDDDQLAYAATDAWLHWRLAEQADAVAAGEMMMDDDESHAESNESHAESNDGMSDDGNGIEPPASEDESGNEDEVRAACYRHERGPRTRSAFGASIADPAIYIAVDEAQDGDAADDGEDAVDEATMDDEERAAAKAAAAAAALVAAKRSISDYFESARTSDLELPSSFSKSERKKLHRCATSFALHSRSVGPEGDRRIIVSRWRPIEIVEASVGAGIVGALVATDVVGAPRSSPRRESRARSGAAPTPSPVPRVVRGRVQAFDTEASTWKLTYDDETVADETVGLDVLNVRLKRRFDFDHGRDGRGEPGAQPVRGGQRRGADEQGLAGGSAPHVGPLDDGYLDRLLDDMKASWDKGKVKYDIRHYMANFGMMAAVEKSSPAFKIFMGYVSDAIYKMLPGEAERVRLHMKMLGMHDEAIRRAPRRYWRRMAKYTCPEPATIIRGLYDVFCFFREMEDPARPGHAFFVDDAEKIFLK